MRTTFPPLLAATLSLALLAACSDRPSPLQAEGATQSVSAAALPDPVLTLEWGFVSKTYFPRKAMRDVFAVAPGDVWAVGDRGAVQRYAGGAFHDLGYVPGSSSDTANHLRGVWGSSANNVIAVGIRTPAAVPRGRVFHYNGTSWTTVQSSADQLHKVWGVSPTVAYAVGSEIVRWNGTGTTRVYGPTGKMLYGVWGSGPDDVFAVGAGGTIVHWDGTSWQVQPTPTTVELRGVWGFGPNDVHAVGAGGTILHYDGTSWTRVATGGGHLLMDVWGPHPDTVMAVGYTPATGHSVQARFDGSTWTYDPQYGASDANGLGVVTSITGWSADEYFVGTDDAAAPQTSLWRVVGGATRAFDLGGVWGFPGGPLFVGGPNGFLLQRVGGRWRQVASGTTAAVGEMFGLSPTDLYALSERSLLRYDGSTWSTVALPAGTGVLTSIWGTKDTLFVTSYESFQPPKLLYRPGRGAAWTEFSLHPDMEIPRDIHGRSTRNMFLTENMGSVWRYDGTVWSKTAQLPIGGDLSVWHDGQSVWVLGQNTLYRRPPDGRWTGVHAVYHSGTTDIRGTASDDVFFAASRPELLRWDGTSIRVIPTPAGARVSRVWISTSQPNELFGVGGNHIVRGTR